MTFHPLIINLAWVTTTHAGAHLHRKCAGNSPFKFEGDVQFVMPHSFEQSFLNKCLFYNTMQTAQ